MLQVKTHLLLQRIGQRRALAPLDQECRQLGDLAEGVVLAQCPLQVARPAGAAGAHAQADHTAYHQEVTVAPVREQLVDLREGVEQFKGHVEERQVTVDGDEQGSAHRGWRDVPASLLEEDLIEFRQPAPLIL